MYFRGSRESLQGFFYSVGNHVSFSQIWIPEVDILFVSFFFF